ncbi:MAG: hypothetical protein ACR2F6_09290 [Mycobacteriales bacterium]
MRPRVAVLVSGRPGAGKSTLAAALGPALGLPVYSKDVVKEVLFDWIGTGDREWSRRLGAAAAEALWAMLAHSPHGGIVEMPMGQGIRELIAHHLADAEIDAHCELWCDVAPSVAASRFAARAAGRHPGHLSHLDVAAAQGRRIDVTYDGPLALGPVLRVPTDRTVDLAAVVRWVREVTGGAADRGVVGVSEDS